MAKPSYIPAEVKTYWDPDLGYVVSDKPAITPGGVIEKFGGMCDGRIVNTIAGPVTLPFLSSWTDYTTTTYTDLDGSSISYTPPAGTTAVIYEFSFHGAYYNTYNPLFHLKFFIDSDEVRYGGRRSYYNSNDQDYHFKCVIGIGPGSPSTGGNNVMSPLYNTWTTPKTMKLQIRAYSSSYSVRANGVYYWDGAGSYQFVRPSIMITAIG